ncbi:MAG: hypothetical protein IPP07_17790 [Holophagales bacterium]|jgi:hypothetical protein|nr:hypothetical protein [Holophagales bacterium]MBK9966625.1 hypothetical protein [Holophagales bacterium]
MPYTEAQAQLASSIVTNLLQGERREFDLPQQVAIADIESDALQFSADMELLDHLGQPAPAIRLADQEPVPIALSAFAGWPYEPGGRLGASSWRRHPFFHEFAHYYLRDIRRDGDARDGYEYLPLDQARATFSRRAVAFLANRIAAVADLLRPERAWPHVAPLQLLQRARGPRITAPGCHFYLSTDSPGLRVFWSGAYYISPNYFSHPTTPAVGVLQAGTYVFGVDGGAYGNAIQWDRNAIVGLPGSPHAHLNY